MPLEPFAYVRECPKCGTTEVGDQPLAIIERHDVVPGTSTTHNGNFIVGYVLIHEARCRCGAVGAGEEHLHVRCAICYYGWQEEVMPDA